MTIKLATGFLPDRGERQQITRLRKRVSELEAENASSRERRWEDSARIAELERQNQRLKDAAGRR